MTRAQVDEYAKNSGEKLLCADGFDDCIVGIGRQFNRAFVVYDQAKVLQSLIAMGMSDEEAVEYFDFNIAGAWVGEATPCFITLELDPVCTP